MIPIRCRATFAGAVARPEALRRAINVWTTNRQPETEESTMANHAQVL